MTENIHPIFETMLSRKEKESLLDQKAIVIWMTGLSGSGKSTIAKGLEKKLHDTGIITNLLDGDNLRSGLNKNLGFSEEDRTENIRRVAETAKLFLNSGVVTICSFVSPTIAIRKIASDIIGDDNFMEVLIDASFEECAKRDVKGLYKKAIGGEIKNFTGLDAPFEKPSNPFIVIDTETLTPTASVEILFKKLIKTIKK